MTAVSAAPVVPPTAAAADPMRSQLWADKYKPRTISEMCYPVCANKLKAWIEGFQPAGTGDPKRPRAVLLSGPPGIGKTTTVYVVANTLGLSVIEYNASDFRSRKSLREHVSGVTNNRTFAQGASSYTNAVLLMDEVDGCDIGGVGEVIEMIKVTRLPILCTCNDRWHPKLRSLMNYVEDMRFTRPPCNIVANYLCDRVLAREGVTLSKPLLQDVIKRSGSDIRNMLNNLQLWCLDRRTLEQRELAECAVQSAKNGDSGLFESAEYFLLQGTSHGERHSIEEMERCYYNADLLDMFVQENYIHFNPQPVDGRDWMGAVSDGANSLSRSDALQRMMYLEQNWSVSRGYVLLSSIAPCLYTRGKYESFMTGQQVFFDRQRPVKFPTWLGNNSTTTKNKRLLRCLTVQALNPLKGVSGNQEDVVTDYIPLGFERPLTAPLVEKDKDGISDVIAFMDQYRLLRDDWDLVQQISHFKHMATAGSIAHPAAGSSSGASIATATKSAFTREFNKTHRFESFAKAALSKIGSTAVVPAGLDEESQQDDGNTQTDDVSAFIKKETKPKKAPAVSKAKKAPAAKKAKKAETSPTKKKPKPVPKKGKRARSASESSVEDSFVVSDSDSD